MTEKVLKTGTEFFVGNYCFGFEHCMIYRDTSVTRTLSSIIKCSKKFGIFFRNKANHSYFARKITLQNLDQVNRYFFYKIDF